MYVGKSVRIIKVMLLNTSWDPQDASLLFQAGSCGSVGPVAYSCVTRHHVTAWLKITLSPTHDEDDTRTKNRPTAWKRYDSKSSVEQCSVTEKGFNNLALKQCDISERCDRIICSVELLLGICQVYMPLIDLRKDGSKINLAVTLEGWVNKGGSHSDFWQFWCFCFFF